MPIKLETINFVIALLTLAVATYGVYYTRKCNHRKITISNGEFISAESNPPIARFEIYNISPLPITILGLEFLSPSGEHIDPIIGYDPTQTSESNHGPFDIHSFAAIAEYQYETILEPPCIIQPYSSIEFGYYFSDFYSLLSIKVTCAETIKFFKKDQEILVCFVNTQD